MWGGRLLEQVQIEGGGRVDGGRSRLAERPQQFLRVSTSLHGRGTCPSVISASPLPDVCTVIAVHPCCCTC